MAHGTVWLPYAQMQTTLPPLEVVASGGCTLTLADGRQLIDGMASWWTACHGYNHPHIVQAISEQAALLPHVMMGGLIHPQAQKLAKRLCELLAGKLNHVFYSESGSVAIEVAMKMALQYWINQGESQRRQFICFEKGYHGDTLFAMSVCDPNEPYFSAFREILFPQYCHPMPTTQHLLDNLENWLSKNASSVAGMLIEPLVQGLGSMTMHSPATLEALCSLCRRYGVLVIFDEIFTGFGRTGSLFACSQIEFSPDIICLSKALTGGTLPLATTITNEQIYQGFLSDESDKALMHGTTFMGNALACAAANASLDLFQNEPRLAQVANIEKILLDELTPLSSLPGVKAVRVKGAIGVVQFTQVFGDEVKQLKQAFIDDLVWCRPFADIIYTTPAFTIETDELIQITSSIKKQVRQWSTNFNTN